MSKRLASQVVDANPQSKRQALSQDPLSKRRALSQVVDANPQPSLQATVFSFVLRLVYQNGLLELPAGPWCIGQHVKLSAFTTAAAVDWFQHGEMVGLVIKPGFDTLNEWAEHAVAFADLNGWAPARSLHVQWENGDLCHYNADVIRQVYDLQAVVKDSKAGPHSYGQGWLLRLKPWLGADDFQQSHKKYIDWCHWMFNAQTVVESWRRENFPEMCRFDKRRKFAHRQACSRRRSRYIAAEQEHFGRACQAYQERAKFNVLLG